MCLLYLVIASIHLFHIFFGLSYFVVKVIQKLVILTNAIIVSQEWITLIDSTATRRAINLIFFTFRSQVGVCCRSVLARPVAR
jgi:hypothetical protein